MLNKLQEQLQKLQRGTMIQIPRTLCLITMLTALVACAPKQSDDNTGNRPTEGETTGTANQAVVANRAPEYEAILDSESSMTMEYRAQPAPEGFKLPFPDADPATDIEPGKHGGQFVFVTRGDGPKTFDPVTANDQPSGQVLGMMFQGLIGFDAKQQKYVPALLKEWYMEEDKRNWILKLREGIKWSDGHPITADDIIFTFQLIYDPNIPNPGKDVLRFGGKNIELEKIDLHTVRAKLGAASGSFQPTIASVQLVPKHMLEPAYQAGQYNTALNINVDPAKLVCSGPFKLKQYQQGERVILERNPHYFRYDKNGTQLPYLDSFIFTYTPDQDAMVLKFRRGEADGIERPRAESIPDLQDAQQAEGFTLFNMGPGLFTHLFWFNLKEGTNKEGKPFVDPAKTAMFKDERFRKACFHALDKESMLRTEMRGMGVSVWNMVSPVLKYWHNPNVAKYPFDQAKAKALLDEMGLKDTNGDGIREDSQGNPASFAIITNKDNKLRERLVNLIAQDLKEVGIDARPQILEFNTLITQTADTYTYEACLLGLSGGGIHPSLSMNVYLSSGRTHLFNPQQEKPATPWEAEIDKLAGQLNATLDFAEQRDIYFKVQEIFAEHCPILTLFNEYAFVAVRNKFGNLKPNVLGELIWNADEFYVK